MIEGQIHWFSPILIHYLGISNGLFISKYLTHLPAITYSFFLPLYSLKKQDYVPRPNR